MEFKAVGFCVLLLSLISITKADRDHDHNESGHQQSQSGGGQGGNLETLVDKIYDNCINRKAACFGNPKDCYKSKEKTCTSLVSISKDKEKKMYKFSLFGAVRNPDDSYVAVGIAKHGKKMANSSIVACINNHQIQTYWSENKGQPTLLNHVTYIHELGSVSVYNQKLICEFNRDAKSTVSDHKFNLDEEKYAILLAKGPLQNGGLGYHESDFLLSEPMYLTSGSSLSKNGLQFSMLFMISFIVTLNALA